ncbi:hypothetical protein L6452_06916 [Arctium lappa]|uniref:Uncharacterized protein n=1 Tax=Arctium lappa TaxID=4217 RepID=A0ACB9EKT6_ARCLA|nr:hypothetical protein L6452_06916 [Arctium lappa]
MCHHLPTKLCSPSSASLTILFFMFKQVVNQCISFVLFSPPVPIASLTVTISHRGRRSGTMEVKGRSYKYLKLQFAGVAGDDGGEGKELQVPGVTVRRSCRGRWR